MDWPEAIRRIRAGEPTQDIIEEMMEAERQDFRVWLEKEAGPEALARHDARLRDLDLGITGARGTWHALSAAQRRVLELMMDGRTLVRAPASRTRYGMIGMPHAIRDVCGLPTVRNLAARELLAWDGGAFDPEARAVLTERGRFVFRHGRHPDPTDAGG